MTIQPLPQNSGALAPAGLTLQDQRRIRAALGSSTSANTRRAYDQAWRRFEVWTEVPWPWSCPAGDVGAGSRVPGGAGRGGDRVDTTGEGPAVATLRLTKSALAAVHRSTGHQDPTDNEGVKRVMAGIARANGRPQRQAKPLTETALAAVKATAKLPRKHQGRARRERAPGMPSAAAGWTSLCCQCCEMVCSGARRPRSFGGATWSSRRTALPCCTSAGPRRIRRQRAWSCTSARRPPRPCRRSCPRIQPSWTPPARVFELSASQIGRRIDAAAKAAGLGEGFTGHSGRVGMAQDLAASGVELPELMTAGRWKSSRMPARYTERQTAGRGAVARYYQGRRG